MKILISIAQYGNNQLNLLKKTIAEFQNYKKYQIDITVHVTENIDINNVNIVYHHPSIRKNLVFKHREEFLKKIDNYDLFLYNENDILITENNIDTFLKYDKILPDDYCLGFIRFEKRENDENLYFPDLNPYFGECIAEKTLTVNNHEYFRVFNIHQGCWLLTREKLKKICNTSHFLYENNSLEHGASSIFNELDWNFKLGGSIKKVYTRDKHDLKNCMIHHLSDKYININSPEWINPYTFKSLTENLQML